MDLSHQTCAYLWKVVPWVVILKGSILGIWKECVNALQFIYKFIFGYPCLLGFLDSSTYNICILVYYTRLMKIQYKYYIKCQMETKQSPRWTQLVSQWNCSMHELLQWWFNSPLALTIVSLLHAKLAKILSISPLVGSALTNLIRDIYEQMLVQPKFWLLPH